MMVDADLDLLTGQAPGPELTRTSMITVLAGGVGAARMLAGPACRSSTAEPRSPPSSTSATTSMLHGLDDQPRPRHRHLHARRRDRPRDGAGACAGETWQAMDTLGRYGGDAWFNLGDRDLGTHLYRTGRLPDGADPHRGHRRDRAAWGLGLRAAAR